MYKSPSRAHLVTYLLALLTATGGVLWMAGPYLQALLLGGLLAMLAAPVRRRLMAAGIGPRTSSALVTLLTLILVFGPIAAVGTLAVRQGVAVGREIMEDRDLRPDALARLLPSSARRLLGGQDETRTYMRDALQIAGHGLTTLVLAVTRAIPELLLQLTLALLSFYFYLSDGRRFMRWLLSLGAFDAALEERLLVAFRDAAASSVLAGATAAACQGALMLGAYLLLGVPAPFLAGAGTFLLSWLPFAGSAPASIAGALYLYMDGDSLRAALMAGIGIFTGLIDNLVRPMVLKGRQEMHPLVGLVAVIGGISLFGLLGILLGPILVSMLTALLEAWPQMRMRLGIDAGRPRRRRHARRVSTTPLALLLWAVAAAPAYAQIDPKRRILFQLGAHETLESRGPLRGYGYLYFNEPNYYGKGRTMRLALAPVYADAELGFKSALSPGTDVGIGLAGGGFADGYSEIRYGRYLRGESFSGHGIKASLGVYHAFSPIGPVPLAGILRVEEKHAFYIRDKDTESSFEMPPKQDETRTRVGLRLGGVEPVALPRRAAEASVWYEGRWRVNSGFYGYGDDRRIQPNSHLFWSRIMAAWPFPEGRRIQGSLTGGTTRQADRFSSFRLGGVLPMTAEFPLSMPGYYYEEISAQNFGLFNASYLRPLSRDLRTWVGELSAASAVVEYVPGLEQPQKSHTGLGAAIGYLGKAWQVFVDYGYGINAVRGHGNGAHSIGLRIQYDFLKAGSRILEPSNLNRGIEQLLRRK